MLGALFSGCADKKAAGMLYIKALEYYEKKDLKNASAFIDKSLELDKKNKQAKFLKAKIHFFQGQNQEAQEILFDLNKSNNDNKDIQNFLIKSLILDKQYKKAREEIQRGLKKDALDWRLHHLAAIVAAKEGKQEERMQALLKANETLKASAQVYFDLSFLWLSLGVKGKAQEFKDKCLAVDKAMSSYFLEEEK